jgi:hypothetical protein
LLYGTQADDSGLESRIRYTSSLSMKAESYPTISRKRVTYLWL